MPDKKTIKLLCELEKIAFLLLKVLKSEKKKLITNAVCIILVGCFQILNICQSRFQYSVFRLFFYFKSKYNECVNFRGKYLICFPGFFSVRKIVSSSATLFFFSYLFLICYQGMNLNRVSRKLFFSFF